jgi:large subunit ribosomal protein L9
MKVVLLQDIKALGKKGELVNASDGYARNYLLPRKLAKEANAAALNEIKNAENAKQFKLKTETEKADESKKILEGKVLSIKAKAGSKGKLFGSVTSQQIADRIKHEYGIEVDKRKIILDTDIKTFGVYKAEIKLFQGINAVVSVMVEEEK